MAEHRPARVWVMRSLYLGLSFFIIFLHLLPLTTGPNRWIAPDMMMALTFAWTIRRPEFVPLLLVAATFLLADLLYHRPPGVLAACTIIGVEFLRSRAHDMRRAPFPLEWVLVGVTIIGVFTLARLITGLALIPQAPLGLTIVQVVMTIAFYPAVVAISHFVFKVQSTLQGSVEDIGSRV